MKSIILIFALLLIPTSAFAYYTEPFGSFHHGPPNICIWDSDYNEQFMEASMLWATALTDKYGKDGVFYTFVVDGDEDNLEFCHINIIVVEVGFANLEGEMQGVLGTTIFPDSDKGNTYIFVYEERGSTESLEEYKNSIIKTTLHEIGHAFGLNHWIPEQMGEALRPWPDTLMWAYQTTDTLEVDVWTLRQFDCIYGANAWEGKNDLCPRLHMDYLGIDLEFKR